MPSTTTTNAQTQANSPVAPGTKPAGAQGKPQANGRPAVVQRILDRQAAKQRQELVADVEQLDTQGRLPAFIGNQAQFRDTIYRALPQLAEKVVRFLEAQPYTYTPEKVDKNGNVSYGAAQQLLPDSAAITPEQLSLLKIILNKAVPAQTNMDLEGKQTNPVADNKVQITINQVGKTPDYHDLPGEVVGINRAHPGAAVQVSTITFDVPAMEITAGSHQGEPAGVAGQAPMVVDIETHPTAGHHAVSVPIDPQENLATSPAATQVVDNPQDTE